MAGHAVSQERLAGRAWLRSARNRADGAAGEGGATQNVFQSFGCAIEQDQPLLQAQGNGIHCPGSPPGKAAVSLV